MAVTGTPNVTTVVGAPPINYTTGNSDPVPAPAPVPGSTPDPASGLYGDLTGANRDAAAFLTDLFTQYGLGTLAPQIVDYLKQGFSSDTIAIMLQTTPEYKARFSANQARLEAGLPVLSPAEYISTENSYRQIMQTAGLPVGFYDSQDDFNDFLAKDVSPTELQGRVQVASDLINSMDPATTSKFASFYGGSSSLVAYALDPTRAEPLLEKQYRAAQIAAQDQGLGVSQSQAEQLAGQGVTQQQAQAGFGFIGQNLQHTQQLANIYGGEQYTLQDALAETFNNDAAAAQKRRRLVAQEQGVFGGTTAVGSGSLTTGDSGQI